MGGSGVSPSDAAGRPPTRRQRLPAEQLLAGRRCAAPLCFPIWFGFFFPGVCAVARASVEQTLIVAGSDLGRPAANHDAAGGRELLFALLFGLSATVRRAQVGAMGFSHFPVRAGWQA